MTGSQLHLPRRDDAQAIDLSCGTSAIEYVRDIALTRTLESCDGIYHVRRFSGHGDAIQGATEATRSVLCGVQENTRRGRSRLFLLPWRDRRRRGAWNRGGRRHGDTCLHPGFANDRSDYGGSYDTSHNTGNDVFAAKINLAGGEAHPPFPRSTRWLRGPFRRNRDFFP